MKAEVGDLLTHAWLRSGICMMVGVKYVDEAGERILWVHWFEENETESCWENELKPLDGEVFNKKINKILDKSPQRDTLLTEPEQRVSP